MNKTIKYSGLVASLTTAAFMGGSAFADTKVADSYDSSTCAVVEITVADEVATSSASLTSQADAYKASAACLKSTATEATKSIKSNAESLEIYSETSAGEANYEDITAKANALIAKVDAMSEDEMTTEDFAARKTAKQILADITAKDEATKKADEMTAEAEKLEKAAELAETAEEAAKTAELKANTAKEAAEAAQEAIDAAKEAGASEENYRGARSGTREGG